MSKPAASVYLTTEWFSITYAIRPKKSKSAVFTVPTIFKNLFHSLTA